jgi:Flp pilus assembly protein TadD
VHPLRAVALNDHYEEAHAYLGLAYAKSGQYSDAIGQFRRALALNGHDAEAHYQLSLALRATGRNDEAEAELSEARRLETSH